MRNSLIAAFAMALLSGVAHADPTIELHTDTQDIWTIPSRGCQLVIDGTVLNCGPMIYMRFPNGRQTFIVSKSPTEVFGFAGPTSQQRHEGLRLNLDHVLFTKNDASGKPQETFYNTETGTCDISMSRGAQPGVPHVDEVQCRALTEKHTFSLRFVGG